MFVKSTHFKQKCQLLLSLIVGVLDLPFVLDYADFTSLKFRVSTYSRMWSAYRLSLFNVHVLTGIHHGLKKVPSGSPGAEPATFIANLTNGQLRVQESDPHPR